MFNQLDKPQKGETTAKIITNYGEMKFRIFSSKVPKSAENFIKHSREGYYNGLIFHRVINDFMIQGGDPTGTGMGGESIWNRPFEDEFDEELRNYRGALSMANAGPNTNGSQFFIVQAKKIPAVMLEQMESLNDEGFPYRVTENYGKAGGTPWLDFKHTVFGQMYEGYDVLDKIALCQVKDDDRPVEDIVIEKIEISEN